MPLNRRQLARGLMALPMAGSGLKRFQPTAAVEPPTPLWELLSLLPARSADAEAIQFSSLRAEMIFPGLLRSTQGLPATHVRPILEADTHHMLAVKPVTPDESLMRFVGVELDSIHAIGAFRPCTIYIGDFNPKDVYEAWHNLGYVPTDDRDIWSWKGLSEREMVSDAAEALLVMQQRLSLPPRSRWHYQFLTCIGDRYVIEARSATTLRQVHDQYAERAETGTVPDWPFGGSGSVPASTGHVAAIYEDDRFVTERRPDSPTDRQNRLRARNEEALASIEQEMGRMPRVRAALLGVTPGEPWRDPIDEATLPGITSTSLVHIQLMNEDDADRYLAIATARFEALRSWYTETPYPELFSFTASASGSRVSIELGHLRTPRYDVLQMAYFSDLAFLTWEPDDRESWRSAR